MSFDGNNVIEKWSLFLFLPQFYISDDKRLRGRACVTKLAFERCNVFDLERENEICSAIILQRGIKEQKSNLVVLRLRHSEMRKCDAFNQLN